MNWIAFLSALLGAIPTLAVSLFMLYAQTRTARSLERVKKELQQDVFKFSKWHEKRVDALLAIFEALVAYLDFLRRKLYVAGNRESMDPMHDFHRTIERQVVYLDDALAEKILRYQGELLLFWNSSTGKEASEEVRNRLDYEIPLYLRRLREDINRFADPAFEVDRNSIVLHHNRMEHALERPTLWDSISG